MTASNEDSKRECYGGWAKCYKMNITRYSDEYITNRLYTLNKIFKSIVAYNIKPQCLPPNLKAEEDALIKQAKSTRLIKQHVDLTNFR